MRVKLRPARQVECCKCKQFYMDDMFFCPKCGGKLTVPDFNLSAYYDLKRYRTSTARAEHISSARIFANNTLMLLSTRLPRSSAELYEIQGMSRISIDKYGPDIIKIIVDSVGKTTEKVAVENLGPQDDLVVKEKLIRAIEAFQPSKAHKYEIFYQKELHDWLKPQFPDIKRERQVGKSRPDLALHKIGIEIKGPTGEKDLHTIADKCVRYLLYFDNLIIVNFDITVNNLDLYKEWKKGIEKQWPEVHIISKSYSESNKCVDCGKLAKYTRCIQCYREYKNKL